MKNVLKSLALVPVLFVSVGAAAEMQNPVDAGNVTMCPATCAPANGGTFTIAYRGSPEPFAWKSSENNQLVRLNFGNLFILDPFNNVLLPDLATHWEVSDDLTMGTFHLREGVQFHDGTPLTARHVEWSYLLTMNPRAEGADFLMQDASLTELKGAQAYIDGTADSVEGITVVDDHTIVFETAVPNGNFFDRVGKVYILPAHLFEGRPMEDVLTEDWWSPEMRVGTGPFVFEEYSEGQFASVTANEDYWAGRPYLDRIVLRFFDEYETGSLAFEKGEADQLDGLTSQDVTRYAETNPEGYVFLRGNPLSANYINVADHPALKDKRVRQAISFAINRQQLIDLLIPYGMRAAIYSVLPEDHHLFNPDAAAYPFDPDRARELLAEANWDPDQSVELATYYEHQDALDWLAFIQKQLGDVGMKTTIRAMKWPDMEKAGEAGELELWLTGYSKDVVSNHLAYFGTGGAWNYGEYNNPEYEELLRSAGRAGGEEQRQIFMKMQEIFNVELPGIPIWNITTFVLVKPQFCGVVEQFSDQHFAYLNENNIYMCEGATGTVSVRPGAPASLEHPGYVLDSQ
ncbi:MAG: ABC transporter substrate-binding protein [Paracoccaceae bacterium]|nr:ABC transporter substrate-binding protein [Paracoccaceae bacterium]